MKWVTGSIVLLLLVAQVIRPAMTNPPIDPMRTIETRTRMTADVAGVLQRSCSDCHSNGTRWPWYSKVAPVSWYLADDVNEGRRHLSLSDWAAYDAKRAANKLSEMCEQVQQGEMPPKPYLLIHKSALLSDADKKLICDWTASERDRPQAASSTR
jgi:hypothetical protein